MGRLPPRLAARPVWLHGSSAGDVVALVPLARRLARAGLPVVTSAWTRSGYEMARRRMDGGVFRAPLDLAGPVGSVLESVRPTLLVLECLEMWPTLVGACQRRGIGVAVVNGRLSERSLGLYRRARWLFGPCFRGISMVSALTDEDAARFVEAGVPAERVAVAPSSKHALWDPLTPTAGPDGGRLVLGSVHRGEERLLLPWIPQLLATAPGLEVVVAPRYPHRAARVQRQLRRLGVTSGLLSTGAADQRVRVVDTIGVLPEQYRGATVSFVGGSLVPRGGHNIVEPAACGSAVLVGPHTAHCQEEARSLVEAGCARVVRSGEEFSQEVTSLLQDRAEAARRGRQGLAVAAELGAAADRIALRLLALLGSEGAASP
jgi:3-deoxy-D-manno-octulosonic-acid transferase